MNLLLYAHYFAPSIGGTETVVLSVARGLAGVPGVLSVDYPLGDNHVFRAEDGS